MTIKVSIECEGNTSREIQLSINKDGLVNICLLDTDDDECMTCFVKLDNLKSMIDKL